jgi:hypothetical protein
MKWPFMLRATHDALMGAMQANLESRIEAFLTIRQLLKDRDEQIAALTKILTSPECNDYTQKDAEKPKKPILAPVGRIGWRTRSQMASEATIPPPADSMKSLEERVKREGGTV